MKRTYVITYERYHSANNRSKLLQFRETFTDAMMVVTVDGEFEVECFINGRRCNLKAVEGSKDFVERLWLVRV